jgi:hypothetical protein
MSRLTEEFLAARDAEYQTAPFLNLASSNIGLNNTPHMQVLTLQ